MNESRKVRVAAGVALTGVLVSTASIAGTAMDAVESDGELRPLTAEAAIETTRFMKDSSSISDINPHGVVSISPDGKRYAGRIVRGDVERDGVEIEFFEGSLSSIGSAAQPRSVARFFSTGLGSGARDTGPHLDSLMSSIKWIGNHRIAFLLSDGSGVRQVAALDLDTGEKEILTHHPTNVLTFDANEDKLVVYNAEAPRHVMPSTELLKQGFVVPDHTDAYNLFRGDLSGNSMLDELWATEWFMQRGAFSEPVMLRVAGRETAPDKRHQVVLSPNGRFALMNTNAPQTPAEWGRYTDSNLTNSIKAANLGRRNGAERHVHQLFVVDLLRKSSRPLWNAASLISLSQMQWSPDSSHVLLAPAFLPADSEDERGLAGRAAAIVNVATGQYEQLSIDVRWYEVKAVRWLGNDEVSIVEGKPNALRRHSFKKTGTAWHVVDDGSRLPALDRARKVRIELREDLNTPPRLFAVNPRTDKRKLILDPNPNLTTRYRLGRVEKIDGRLRGGELWEALLFYPVGYSKNRRYPLVIQSVYSSDVVEAFTLYGDQDVGLGPAQLAPYPGQVLANRGIAVLNLNVRMPAGGPAEARLRREAFEQTAEHLVASGLVDRTKVGLAGFSRNGYYVEYTLAHSSFPFAAAVAADNWDPSYFQQTLLGYPDSASAAYGSAPFGEGLKSWLADAPGFNAESIRAPLLKVAQTSGLFSILGGWEVYSRLRFLKKPVEFYVMPDAELHGAHNTQNPRQLLAVQQGSADWFDFWLNGHEDPRRDKEPQYLRWRRLRELHQADLLTLRPRFREECDRLPLSIRPKHLSVHRGLGYVAAGCGMRPDQELAHSSVSR